MGISRAFENHMQSWHKIRGYLLLCLLVLIICAGYWILIEYGVDEDLYFWIGLLMMIIPGLAILLRAILRARSW